MPESLCCPTTPVSPMITARQNGQNSYFTASFAWSLALRLSSLQSNVNISVPLQGWGFLRVNVLLTRCLHTSSLWSKQNKTKQNTTNQVEESHMPIRNTNSGFSWFRNKLLYMDHYIYISVSLSKGFSPLYFIHLLIISGINGECNIICLVLEEL